MPNTSTALIIFMLLDAFSISSVVKGVFISAGFMVIGSSVVTYGVPFSHLLPELQISSIHLKISSIHLEISPIQLAISTNRPI